MSSSPDFNSIVLKADQNALEQARLYVVDSAEKIPLPPDKIFKLELALEEILVNVVSYAYPETAPGDVEVGCGINNQTITITIRDKGKAFDPLQKETPDLEQNIEERPIGGLGIFLTREMVDSITYERIDDQNVTTFSITANRS